MFTKPATSFLEPPPVKRARPSIPKSRKGIAQKETGLPVVENVAAAAVQSEPKEDVVPEKGGLIYEMYVFFHN